MIFKNNNQNTKVFLSIVMLLLVTAIWNQIYLVSQNVLLTNPNWYSYKSTFVDTYATTNQVSMSRTSISAGELNLRSAIVSDMILNRHKSTLSELEFTFTIPNNSHLDILYNFKNHMSSFVRLSRSSLHESGFYDINDRGIYTKFTKKNIVIDSEKKMKAQLKQVEKGIIFSIDNKVVGLIPGDKFKELEFGFESGMVGAIVSEVKARDINGKIVPTFVNNNSRWIKYYIKNLLITLVFVVVFFFIANVLKGNINKRILSFLYFATLLGILWLVYDYYYYSKKGVHWDREAGTTRFFDTPEKDIDFEVIRFRFFSLWAQLLGDRSVTQSDFDKRFGKTYANYPLEYCLNLKCSSFENKENIQNQRAKNRTVRLAMIGLSTTDSTGIRVNESSTFVEMHNRVVANNKKIDIESFNFSRPSFKFTTYSNEFIQKLVYNKIDIVVILLKIRFSTRPIEILAFENFLKVCKQHGIKTVYINDPINPEKIVFLTSLQARDTLSVVMLNHQKHNEKMYPIFDKYRKYDLSILEPEEVFNNQKNISAGKIWWDYGHLTSYGHEIFGNWIGDKLGTAL